jgi:hypothetical protein
MCLWLGSRMDDATCSVSLGLLASFAALFVFLFGALSLLFRLDTSWILMYRAAGATSARVSSAAFSPSLLRLGLRARQMVFRDQRSRQRITRSTCAVKRTTVVTEMTGVGWHDHGDVSEERTGWCVCYRYLNLRDRPSSPAQPEWRDLHEAVRRTVQHALRSSGDPTGERLAEPTVIAPDTGGPSHSSES